MRIKLITCVSFARTLVSAVARSKNIVQIEILQTDYPSGCQDCNTKETNKLNKSSLNFPKENCQSGLIELKLKLHALICDAESNGFNAVLILFDQKCRELLSGIEANKIPVVIPKSFLCHNHLCKYHTNNQRLGNYFKNTDTTDHHRLNSEPNNDEIASLIERLNAIKNNSSLKPEGIFEFWEKLSEAEAEWFGWDFEKMDSDYLLLQKFVDGFWSYTEFIVLMPGDQLVIDSEIGNIALKKAH